MPYLIPQNPPSLIPAGDLALQAGAASGQAEAARLLAGTLANSRRSVMANAQAMGSLGGPRVTTLQSALMEQERRRKAQADRQAADLEHRQRQMTWERDREAQLEDEKRTRGYQVEDEDRARAVREQDPVWIEQRRQAKEATSRAQAREAIERIAPRIAGLATVPGIGGAIAQKVKKQTEVMRERAGDLSLSPEDAVKAQRDRADARAKTAAEAKAAASDAMKVEEQRKAAEATGRARLRDILTRMAPHLAGLPGVASAVRRGADDLAMSPDEAAKERRRRDEVTARTQKQESDAKAQAAAALQSAGVKMAQDFAETQKRVAMERAPMPQADRDALVDIEKERILRGLIQKEEAMDINARFAGVSPDRYSELEADAYRMAEGKIPQQREVVPVNTPGMQAIRDAGGAEAFAKALFSFDPDAQAAIAEIGATFEDLARVLAETPQ